MKEGEMAGAAKKPGVVPIGDARKISEQRNVPLVVIFAIHSDREQFTVTTYGATKAFCRVAADYGTKLAEAIMESRVVAAQVEPTHLPDEPTVWTRALSSQAPSDAK
jgi:Zn-dependent peptidase ImmA (M78 family)